MTTDTPPPRFEDRLLEALEQHLTQSPFDAAAASRLRRPPVRRRLALGAAAAALGAVALVLVATLGGSPPAPAQAAVLTDAVKALDQPNTITELAVQDYSANGMGPCFLGLAPPLPCIGNPSGADTQSGISADPANDTLTYSAQEWISADGSQTHTIYNNGDELATDASDNGYEAFDAADNTLTTLTGVSVGGGSAPSGSAPDPAAAGYPLGIDSTLSDPSYYEQLYQEALAGGQSTDQNTTVTSQLVGQTTLSGESVDELQFTVHFNPPADPPAGDLCGTTTCTPPDQVIQLYLDAQTYLPVRSVMSIDNTRDLQGVPPGDAVWQVADFSVQSLPDTPANEALLGMSSHPGATAVTESRQQWVDSLTASSPTAAKLRRGRAHHGARR